MRTLPSCAMVVLLAAAPCLCNDDDKPQPERQQIEHTRQSIEGWTVHIDTRLLAGVLTRELAREGRLAQLTIDLVDRPGTLGKVANILGNAGANIVEVYHQRVFTDLPAKAAVLEVVIETRDRAHLDETVGKLRAAGLEVEMRGNSGGGH